MTKVTNFLATVTDVNSEFPAKGSAIPNSERCVIKDQTSQTSGSVGAVNNWYVDESAQPLASYTSPRLPRWQDLVQTTTTTTTASCPTCTYLTQIGTTTSCSGGTATQNISINSSCGNSEARLAAVGNGAVTTGWVNVVLGTGIYSFANTTIGRYRVEIRPKSIVTTCISQFSGEFNVCCNTSPNWVNTGGQYCDGCAIKQLQTDTNFCSSTYNQTQVIIISGSSSTCGTWGSQTQYCANYGVYPFELRTHEVNTCGQTRNDSLVANLSPTCGYTCGYWGLSITFNGYYCNSNTNGTGVVTVNPNASNGSYEVRLVSTGAGVTTGWQTGSTFTGVYDGTYYAQIRSTSDNNCTATTVGTAQNYQTVACCNTTPNWVSNGSAYCDNCVSKQPQIDNNPCSSSYNQTRVINSGTACNTTQNWVNTGNYDCYGTCDKYNVEVQNNPCASGYNTTRQGSLVAYNNAFCGGCCGQSTSANWVNTGLYSCYGSCNKYNVEQDNNSCSSTYGQTRQGSLVESNSGFCYISGFNCCGQSTAPNWVNNGSSFCSSCYLFQPQIDNNACSSTYNQTRNVDLGVNSTCGSWPTVYYCVGYDYYSKEVNSCTGAERNVTLVQANSPSCGYSNCTTWNIFAYNSDEYVYVEWTNCGGGSSSTSFYSSGGGIVGSVCAQNGTTPSITSGNGAASNTGSMCT
jgi:hypothetical protein